MTNKSILTGCPDRALFVMDMTHEHCALAQQSSDLAMLIRMISGEIDYFRRKGRPILFFISKFLERSALELEKSIIASLAPRASDKVICKPSFSCFYNTELDVTLALLKVNKITLTGMQTHTSVLCTAIDAFSRGLEVATPQTCVYSRDHRKHELALKLIREDFFPYPPDLTTDAFT